MARPRKHRNVCGLPGTNKFGPLSIKKDQDKFVNMTIDQYETIRLIDLEDLTQEECASQMKIARTTVQRIYSEARKIIAESLVKGKVLKIEGGDYKLCNGRGKFCGRGNCHKGRKGMDSLIDTKGEMKLMKIAIPVNEKSLETEVAENFGRAEYFLIYDIESKEKAYIDNKASSSPGGAGVIAAQTLVDSEVDALITPECGRNASGILIAKGVKVYKNINDDVEKNIEKIIEGALEILE
ncbi:MAG: DUF134 domain-containing protein [Tissierella sp.]|uniref:DUF134 domain-containing protein n=1 Tax=Tissierella sp. TaxID=41274 RepID=UPI003F97EFB1